MAGTKSALMEWEGGGREKKRNRRAMGVGREANLGNRDQKLFSSFFLPLGCFGHEPQCCGGDLLCLLYTLILLPRNVQVFTNPLGCICVPPFGHSVNTLV